MPRDLVQIALEHHRAGRLVQAEEVYRAALAADPADAHAAHWLGVLLLQAGQTSEALSLLQSAAEKCPNDAAYLHNLAQAQRAAGELDASIATLQRAVAIPDAGHEPLVALAQAHMARAKAGDAEAAAQVLRRARALQPDALDVADQLAVALLAARRFSEAADVCKAALAKKPDHAGLYYHLALASRGLGEAKETRKALIKALEIEPAFAAGWCALAMLDGEAGNHASAAGLFRRAIAARRYYRPAYEGLAQALTKQGKSAEAQAVLDQLRTMGSPANEAPRKPADAEKTVAALQRHLTPTADQARAHYAMAALLNVFPPTQTPGDAVAGLFDRYANVFDEHLVGRLEYGVPEKIAEAVKRFWNGQLLDIFDAGCGTGLCGALLRPMARSLIGVDLSPAMIDMARQRNIYDRLEIADLLESLRKEKSAYDILVCADVLIYIGEPAPFFEAATGALRPGGLIAFSAEASEAERYELVPRSRRYRHSKPYLRHLARIYGFEELLFEALTIRKEHGQPVAGFLVVLRQPA